MKVNFKHLWVLLIKSFDEFIKDKSAVNVGFKLFELALKKWTKWHITVCMCMCWCVGVVPTSPFHSDVNTVNNLDSYKMLYSQNPVKKCSLTHRSLKLTQHHSLGRKYLKGKHDRNIQLSQITINRRDIKTLNYYQ